jgi:hypothetical protein
VAWPKDSVSSASRSQLGQTNKFELFDENSTGVQSEVSAESTMNAAHFLLFVVVEDEKSVGCGEVRLVNELACTVSLSSRQPKESSKKSQETFSFQK